MSNNELTVAIAGNPNCGKTTLFNLLTGSQQKVGNWAGVTVDKKIGKLKQQKQIKIIDLPGIHSLGIADSDSAIDERIACQYLLKNEADLIINIVDANHLQHHLYLTLQLLEIGIPCIIAVNMMDIAAKQKLSLDFKKFSHLLNCPVMPLTCSKKRGVEQLITEIVKFTAQDHQSNFNYFPAEINQAITLLSTNIQNHYSKNFTPSQCNWLAIRLLEKDVFAKNLIKENIIHELANHLITQIEHQHQEESDIILADYRYQFITELMNQSCKQDRKTTSLTEKLDQVLLHRWFGIPIFFLAMYLVFEFSMSIGTLLQPLLDLSSATLFIDGTGHLAYLAHLPNWLIAILTQGIGLGINTVLSFTPQIALLFLALSFLEDSGYMARAAFVMDRLMQWVGLPGKSFIPLIIGFGCNVPAIMATRTLENPRDRILTTMMTPFMSCGARLAIFVVFGTTFFPQHAGLMIFLLYLAGIVVALITGFLLKHTILRGKATAFVLELPSYHAPLVKNILIMTWQRLKGFVFRAGKVIIPICVLVGGLNSIQISNDTDHHQSILALLGQKITPVLTPMGVTQDNWPASVGLLTGTLAKEVVIGTLNTLYTQNKNSNQSPDLSKNFNLWQGLKTAVIETLQGFKNIFTMQNINPFTVTIADHEMSKSAAGQMALAFASTGAAFSYLLFVLLYIPCASTIGAIAREIGLGWSCLATIWSFNIAYTAAVICYQISTWTAHPIISCAWIIGLSCWQIFWFLALKIFAHQKKQAIIQPITSEY